MKNIICKIEGCHELVFAKELCNRHYTHFRKYGNYKLPPKRMKGNGKCSLKDCNNPYFGKGYCSKHYARLKRNGDPVKLIREYHGMTGTSEHNTWRRMIARCIYPSLERYPRYGGRGIKVCDRWLDSFTAFYRDMGKKPFHNAQIDRIDNDGNYEPGNCRWVTRSENCLNRSTSKKNKII